MTHIGNVIELVGSSSDSFDDAVRNAVAIDDVEVSPRILS